MPEKLRVSVDAIPHVIVAAPQAFRSVSVSGFIVSVTAVNVFGIFIFENPVIPLLKIMIHSSVSKTGRGLCNPKKMLLDFKKLMAFVFSYLLSQKILFLFNEE